MPSAQQRPLPRDSRKQGPEPRTPRPAPGRGATGFAGPAGVARQAVLIRACEFVLAPCSVPLSALFIVFKPHVSKVV